MSWQHPTLGDLIELENGYAFKSDEYADGGHFLMRIANVQQGYISKQAPKYVSIPQKSNLKQFELSEGDMLMSLTGNVGRVGLIETHHLPAALNQRVAKIKIKDSSILDKGYLFSFLNTDDARVKIENLANGAAQLNVSTKDIKSLSIPLPPLAEQRRIAAVLDKAEEIKRKREAAIAKLDQLAQSVFVEMFGCRSQYEHKPLSSVCQLITDGTHYTPTYVNEGVVFLSAKNVTSGFIDWKNIKHIPDELHLKLQKRVSPKKGDVLLAKNGTTGVAAVVDKDIVFDIYVSLALLRPSDLILSGYLHAALNSTLVKRHFSSSLKGIGVPNLHLVDIRNAVIPVPPINIQESFVQKLNSIYATKSSHSSALSTNNRLFTSLQHQAFTTGFET